MVRMSDILKRVKERKKEEDKTPPEPVEAAPPPVPPQKQEITPQAPPSQPPKEVVPPPKKEPLEERQKPSGVRISHVVMKESRVFTQEETLRLFNEAISFIEELMNERKLDFEHIDIKRAIALVENIVDQLTVDNGFLVELAYSTCPAQRNYLVCHPVNVCIYSVEIGIYLHYDKFQLMDVGTAAFLHDIGMRDYKNLANQPRKLTPSEFEEVKNHPTTGAQILEGLHNLNKKIVQTVYQEHERLDGTGYPKGIKEKFINEYARIVAVADVYSAMVHPRPYRNNERILPMEVVRQILDHNATFEAKVIKALIGRIGVFPPGSFVELNTKEIARVIKGNRTYPLRPLVRVVYSADGNPLEGEKVIDLGNQSNIYVTKCVSPKEKTR